MVMFVIMPIMMVMPMFVPVVMMLVIMFIMMVMPVIVPIVMVMMVLVIVLFMMMLMTSAGTVRSMVMVMLLMMCHHFFHQFSLQILSPLNGLQNSLSFQHIPGCGNNNRPGIVFPYHLHAGSQFLFAQFVRPA